VGSVSVDASGDCQEGGVCLDDLTGLPVLSSVLGQVESHLTQREQVGFLYFDVVQFHLLTEAYGRRV